MLDQHPMTTPASDRERQPPPCPGAVLPPWVDLSGYTQCVDAKGMLYRWLPATREWLDISEPGLGLDQRVIEHLAAALAAAQEREGALRAALERIATDESVLTECDREGRVVGLSFGADMPDEVCGAAAQAGGCVALGWAQRIAQAALKPQGGDGEGAAGEVGAEVDGRSALVERCPSRHDSGIHCTLPEGHGGPHEGLRTERVIAWASGTDPERARLERDAATGEMGDD